MQICIKPLRLQVTLPLHLTSVRADLPLLLGLVDWAIDVTASRSVQALLSPSVSRSQEVLKFKDRFMASNRNELTAFDASEGVLYVLFTTALCLSSRGPNLIAIDNLDQAL
jgi:hypothetical protein